jgi:hypothetical protein
MSRISSQSLTTLSESAKVQTIVDDVKKEIERVSQIPKFFGSVLVEVNLAENKIKAHEIHHKECKRFS